MTDITIAAPLAAALAAKGYASLTSVQQAVLESDAQGRDMLVSAQTGSGKTVAFGLAIAPQLLQGDALEGLIQGVDLVCVTDWDREGLVSGFTLSHVSVLKTVMMWRLCCRSE